MVVVPHPLYSPDLAPYDIVFFPKVEIQLIFQSLAVTLCTTRFNIQQFYMVLTLLCMELRTNCNFYLIQHQLTGFYNQGGECLLRGTN
jgi:hypothetical protein